MDRFVKRINKDEVEKPAKKRKNNQKYLEEYRKLWPCLLPGREGYAFCTVCHTEFSVSHGGRDDCRRHVACGKHVEFERIQISQQSVSSFFTKPKEEHDVIKAETLFVRFLVEHNIPFSAADHAAPLFSKMFPDSDIAKKFSCAHTKTNAIARCIADVSKEKIISKLRGSMFSLSTDGSNDIDAKKLYPLVINYYDDEKGEIVTSLLSLLESTDNTGDGIFRLIDSEFTKLQIEWNNCISFCSDNANTMTGRFKGVATFIKEKQPNIKFIRCLCHLIHLAAQKATNTLPVDLEALSVQIFYYLEKSSKRKSELKECQNMLGEKPHKILKHVNTRWLSLQTALERIIEQWEPLKKFFSYDNESLGKKNEQFMKLERLLQSAKTKLYFFFVLSAIPTFTKVNVALQKQQPCIHTLKEKMHDLYFELLVRFITPTAISKSESLFSIDLRKRKNQKSNEELVIGSSTRAHLTHSQLSSSDIEEFYCAVRNFFCMSCEYILKKFPLEDDFFKHASVANIHSRKTASYQSIKYFADLFQCYGDNDQLELEFALYQNDTFSADITECERIDTAWYRISQLKNGSGNLKYAALSKLILSLLVVPHSNAATERIFSMIRKNQTDMRSTMNIKTLESLLISKLNMDCCYSTSFSVDEIKKAKSACYMLQKI